MITTRSQTIEAGQTVLIQRYYFAIDDSCGCFDRWTDFSQFGKPLIKAVSPT
jgi:hypothetical protein